MTQAIDPRVRPTDCAQPLLTCTFEGAFQNVKMFRQMGKVPRAFKGAGAIERRRMAHAETRLLVFLRDSSEYTSMYCPVMYRYGSIVLWRRYCGIMGHNWGYGVPADVGARDGGICGTGSGMPGRLLIVTSSTPSLAACIPTQSTQTGTPLSRCKPSPQRRIISVTAAPHPLPSLPYATPQSNRSAFVNQ